MHQLYTVISHPYMYYCQKYFFVLLNSKLNRGAVVAVIVWWLDLQLPIQSVSITTDVVSSNLDQGKVYNNM